MIDLTRQLERMANEPRYKQRILDIALLRLAAEMGLFNEDGELVDPELRRAAETTDPNIGGRPLHHYMGLTRAQLRQAGLSPAEMERLAGYVTPADDEAPTDAVVAPEEPTSDGAGHPDLAKWAEEPAAATPADAVAAPEQPAVTKGGK